MFASSVLEAAKTVKKSDDLNVGGEHSVRNINDTCTAAELPDLLCCWLVVVVVFFFLACENLGRMFDQSFPASTLCFSKEERGD